MKSLIEKTFGGSNGFGQGVGGGNANNGGGAFLTETNTIKIKEKQEIKIEKLTKKPLPPLKEEKIEQIKIQNTEPEKENQKVKKF
jgi:hypothetical protein